MELEWHTKMNSDHGKDCKKQQQKKTKWETSCKKIS